MVVYRRPRLFSSKKKRKHTWPGSPLIQQVATPSSSSISTAYSLIGTLSPPVIHTSTPLIVNGIFHTNYAVVDDPFPKGKSRCKRKPKVELGEGKNAKECKGMSLAVQNGRPFQDIPKSRRNDKFQWRCSLGRWEGCNLSPTQGPADHPSALSEHSHAAIICPRFVITRSRQYTVKRSKDLSGTKDTCQGKYVTGPLHNCITNVSHLL